MKRLISIVTIIVGLSLLFSCEEFEEGPVLDYDKTTAPTLQGLDQQSYVLDSAQANEILVTFTWSEADFGVDLEKSYSLQMDFAGNNFADPSELVNTQDDSVSFTVADMNNRLLIMGVAPGEEKALQFRVSAYVNQYTDTLHSEALEVTMQPYEVVIDYPEIYVPGAYQGWSPGTAPPIYDVNNNNVYEGYLLIATEGGAGSAFKFTQDRSWDTNWGDNEAGGTQIGDGTLEPQGIGNDIFVPDSAYYKLTANLNDLTYQATKTHWSILGSATGDQIMDMTYDQENQIWTVTADFAAGEFQFISKDSEELISGETSDLIYGMENPIYVQEDGAPIPIESSGNYTITLDLSRPPYGYKVSQN